MKTLYKLVLLAFFSASFVTACDNFSSEKQKASEEKAVGNVQEVVGKATDDTELKNKGKKNQIKGDVRSTKEDVKDAITN